MWSNLQKLMKFNPKRILIIVLAVIFTLTACGPLLKSQTIKATPTLGDVMQWPTGTETVLITTKPTVTFTSTPKIANIEPTPINLAPDSTKTIIVLEQPTVEPTLETDVTLDDLKLPNSLVQIEEPGELSQLASPIRVMASVFPGDGGLVNVQLFGENGRLIFEQLMKLVHTESGWVQLVTEVKFEINTAGESGLLVLSTRDEFGRRIVQSAVPVILMQIGKSEVEAPEFLKQAFIIQSPVANAVVKGGTLSINGYAHPFNNNPIIIELMTQTGGVMESKVVKLPKLAEGQRFVNFSAEIPYTVDIRTPIRITIRQRSELLPNVDIALSSQIVYLDP